MLLLWQREQNENPSVLSTLDTFFRVLPPGRDYTKVFDAIPTIKQKPPSQDTERTIFKLADGLLCLPVPYPGVGGTLP